jgi:hypothetical protein
LQVQYFEEGIVYSGELFEGHFCQGYELFRFDAIFFVELFGF